MKRYRPTYLKSVRCRVVKGQPDVRRVVLLARGVADLPERQRTRCEPGVDVLIGHLERRVGTHGSAGRFVWGYDGSGAFGTAREAAESMAVRAMEGSTASHRMTVAAHRARQVKG